MRSHWGKYTDIPDKNCLSYNYPDLILTILTSGHHDGCIKSISSNKTFCWVSLLQQTKQIFYFDISTFHENVSFQLENCPPLSIRVMNLRKTTTEYLTFWVVLSYIYMNQRSLAWLLVSPRTRTSMSGPYHMIQSLYQVYQNPTSGKKVQWRLTYLKSVVDISLSFLVSTLR